MIERMDANSVPSTRGKRGPIRSLILLPTRELAMQVLEAYWKLVPNSKNDAVLVCGGLSENTQLDQLDRGPRLVVATPGRLEDFLRRRSINLSSVEMFVLDEVDRMLDMGFLPAIRRIVGAIPKTRQTMCYSATLDANIREIVRDYVSNPVRIEIGTTSKPSDRVELRIITVMQDQKLGLLDQMLRKEEGTFLVFSRTKHGADRISKKLEKLGHDADVIHGDRSQSQRTAALKGFANGKHRILVATDVAARGIDVNDIAHVVNYDLPNATEDFVHRIGRTGRAGKKGVATSFVMPQEKSDARKLERELKIKFDWQEADKNIEKEERNKPLDLNQSQRSSAAGDALLEGQRARHAHVHAQPLRQPQQLPWPLGQRRRLLRRTQPWRSWSRRPSQRRSSRWRRSLWPRPPRSVASAPLIKLQQRLNNRLPQLDRSHKSRFARPSTNGPAKRLLLNRTAGRECVLQRFK